MGHFEQKLPASRDDSIVFNQAGAIADLVRAMVHARKGVSRTTVEDWVLSFTESARGSDLHEQTRAIIDLLCDLQDIGYGVVRGEQVLVSLPERRIELPDGMIVVLGDHGLTQEAPEGRLFPLVKDGASTTLLEYLKPYAALDTGGSVKHLGLEGKWDAPASMPLQLRAALALTGEFNPRTDVWAMNQANADFLNGWLGTDHQTVPAEGQAALDRSQLDVIEAPADEKSVVEAGPGSGKTHTATERVIRLIEEDGVVPSRILLLSFTRMAVAEIRARVLSRVQDIPQAGAVQIRTFDSFAARVLSIAGADAGRSFDDSIRRANRALNSDNPLLEDGIRQIEHVIIDEAQDLVGLRKEFCSLLLGRLDPDCGVTVFGDFAQSIYGYQAKSKAEATFLDEVKGSRKFKPRTLAEDHRTKTPELKELFSDARSLLRNKEALSKDSYFTIRGRIREATKENDIEGFENHPSTTSGMILTRSRNALYRAAEDLRRAGRRFRIRLPDRPEVIDPWIGATLGGLPGTERVTPDDFMVRLKMLEPAAGIDPDRAWEILLELDGSGKKTVRIGHIAEALMEPPRDLVRDYQGNSGPLLSTIHAIKGREAERIMLLLTAAYGAKDTDWGEEARILYVGASRASRELRTGWINPGKLYSVGKPERHWVPHHDYRQIEIGLADDVIPWEEFIRSMDEGDVALALFDIWKAGAMECPGEIVWDDRGVMRVQCANDPGRALGHVSESFIEAVDALCMEDEVKKRPERISGFAITGATTVVTSESHGKGRALGLMPLLGGFATVPRIRKPKS